MIKKLLVLPVASLLLFCSCNSYAKTSPNKKASNCCDSLTKGITSKLLWAGIYRPTNTTKLTKLASSPTGIFSKGGGKIILQRNTDTIPAKLGVYFGIRYQFSIPECDLPNYHVIRWTYPNPGLRNPVRSKAQVTFSYEKNAHCNYLIPCIAGTQFTEPWELVPGLWKVEILIGNSVQMSKSFKVVALK